MKEKPIAPYHDTPPQSIKEMVQEIMAEGSFTTIPLLENIKVGDTIPLFADALSLKNKTGDPDGIVFYSLATGILKHSRDDDFPIRVNEDSYYRYKNNSYNLEITLNKKTAEARVASLTSCDKVQDQQYLTTSIARVESIITGAGDVTSRMDKAEIESYLLKLKELKEKLDNLIQDLENKSEPEKKE